MSKKVLSIILVLVLALSLLCLPVSALEAMPTNSTVLVNGTPVAFDAYNINDNNYFKLRDVAYILNGTAKQFAVGWDEEANVISLTSGQLYIAVGGEMEGKGSSAKTPTLTDSKILLNGVEVSLTAYNIDGNNYFKLRNIGAAFDFGVDWDEAQNTIIINTDKGYTPEISTAPKGTWSLPPDDGSFESYRARALVANFQVILDETEKSPEWETDTYTITYPGSPGGRIVIPSNRIVTESDTTITSISISTTTWYSFPASLIDEKYSGRLIITDAHIAMGSWNGLRQLGLDKVCIVYFDNDKNLVLSYPETFESSEAYTYNSFTNEARQMIDATYKRPGIDKEKLREYVAKTLSVSADKLTGAADNALTPTTSLSLYSAGYRVRVNYLKEWQGSFFFKIGYDQISLAPNPDTESTPLDFNFGNEMYEPFKDWCNAHIERCIISVHSEATSGLVMLAEVNNYIPPTSNERPLINGWNYDGNLTVDWAYPTIEFANPITINDKSITEVRDTTGLTASVPHPLSGQHPASYGNLYHLNFKDAQNDFSNEYFHMTVLNNDITIKEYEDSKEKIVLTVGSNVALADGKPITVKPPKIVDGVVYLPAEFIITNVFKKELNNTPADLSGLVELKRRGDDELYSGKYYIEYKDSKKDYSEELFDVMIGDEPKSFKIYIGNTINCSLTLTLNSTTARIWNGTEYKDVIVKAPKEIFGKRYVPFQIIIDTFFK